MCLNDSQKEGRHNRNVFGESEQADTSQKTKTISNSIHVYYNFGLIPCFLKLSIVASLFILFVFYTARNAVSLHLSKIFKTTQNETPCSICLPVAPTQTDLSLKYLTPFLLFLLTIPCHTKWDLN